jgi:hypothetical protein
MKEIKVLDNLQYSKVLNRYFNKTIGPFYLILGFLSNGSENIMDNNDNENIIKLNDKN